MEVLKELRSQKKISQAKLADDLHVTQATVSRWETGEMLPTIDILNDLAKYFSVSVDFLLQRIDEVQCPECGFLYSPLTQNSEHEKYHYKWKKAIDKFGFCWGYREAEGVRHKSIQIINDTKATEKDIIDAFDDYLRAEFSLSLRNSGFDLNHVTFKDFCPIQLNKWDSKDAVSNAVFKKLIDKYGMDNSRYYHPAINKEPISEDDRLRAENNELFDQLPTDKKQEALNYLRFLVEHQDQGKE